MGLTQADVAERLGITPQHYQRIEYGVVVGKVELWDTLEDLLGANQRWLREDAGRQSAPKGSQSIRRKVAQGL